MNKKETLEALTLKGISAPETSTLAELTALLLKENTKEVKRAKFMSAFGTKEKQTTKTYIKRVVQRQSMDENGNFSYIRITEKSQLYLFSLNTIDTETDLVVSEIKFTSFVENTKLSKVLAGKLLPSFKTLVEYEEGDLLEFVKSDEPQFATSNFTRGEGVAWYRA